MEALANLKKRGCKIIWLNPLKGWKDYAPVTASMAASLPYLDLFSAANTLNDLAALDEELEKLCKFENEDKSILDLAQGLASSGQAFAYATVIRTAGATSAKPGAKAIISSMGKF